MKTFLNYIYHLVTWILILVWGTLINFLTSGKRFVSRWNEVVTIPIGFIAWYFSPLFLRWIDPTAATFDSGVLQLFLLAGIGLYLGNGIVWLLIKITFPGVYKFLDTLFEEALLYSPSYTAVSDREKMFNLSTYQKCVISLSVLALYFLAFIVLVKVL